VDVLIDDVKSHRLVNFWSWLVQSLTI